ncbi:BREX system P-loop protein BrxC [Clostridium sp. Sa3CUN1]|uniref:BREX system P-loop protein BrxC n=1 Tax=Clostridium gallinarum TaxID=2762246 RepID=A0ABR8Q0J1_9CLOT|nr:BREX system P-loop protein BrxC [Clostridium gallinarum]MBD7913943.1 BREX system P-loop protein BrxC [Clostridium gallinarum]
MKIENMFLRDIKRDIDGVIKVDFTDKIDNELEEYVVTKEIAKHLSKFYNNYAKGVDGDTTKMGVWISGFFGSGKSHFLKILSYLLSNKSVGEKKAIDYFKSKIEDPMLLAEIQRISKIETETILFNIDSKSPVDNKGKENAILKVFIKVFDEHRGLCDTIPGVANMERTLIKDGVYDKFKLEFERIRGFKWIDRRNGFFLDKKYVAEAIAVSMNIPNEDAIEYLENSVVNYSVDIETFAKEVKEYLDTKGDNFHLIFLADEIGQYIGNNGSLMLNLQTITEKLSSECKGKAWVIVTSQEKIDAVCTNVKEDDFSKIQGRFDTKLSMSSMSVDEVIKKRILEKTENTKMLLSNIYREENTTLRNIISFDGARKDLLSYSDENDFIETYPFVPYQFKVLQSVFEQVRKHGNSGKHLSEGERSMLSAFKESVQIYSNSDEGLLIPFDIFYESIVEFLNPTITRVIDRAATKNVYLKDDKFNIRVLKLLFMLKYLNDELPANLENITTLMIDNINVDKQGLRLKVEKALKKIEDENLIQKSGDVYVFLTDDEQDVNRDIALEKVEDIKVSKELSDYIFKQIYDQKKFRFITNNKLKYDKDYNKKMDGIPSGNNVHEFGVSILSRLADNYFKSDEALKMDSYNNKEVIIKLKDGEYIDELTQAMKIESYIDKTNIDNLPTNKQKIIADKKDERRQRRTTCLSKLENAIMEAEFYIYGEKVDIKGASAADKIKNALSNLCKFVYLNIDYIKTKTESIDDIIYILKTSEEQTTLGSVESYNNEIAEKEVDDFIKLTESMEQVRVKSLVNRFTTQPYGWDSLDVAGVLAKLLVDEKIRCKLNGEFLTVDEPRKTAEALTQTSNIDRVIVNKKVKVDERIVNQVKNISMELFKETSDSRNEDEIAKELRKSIERKLENIESNLQLYTNKKYPGKSLFEKGRKLFNESKEFRENISLFNWLINNELELLEWVQDVELPIDFFNNQREIFDKGLLTSEKCQNNKDYLTEDILINLEKLNKILNNPIPYKDIRKIISFVDEIEAELEKKLEEKREEAISSVNSDYEFLKLQSNQYGVSYSTKDRLISEYDLLISEVREQKDIYRIDAKITQSSRKRENFEKIIAKDIKATEERDKQLQTKSLNTTNTATICNVPVERPKKVIEKVKVSSLLNVKSIKTEQEVDVYIRELSMQLKKIIRSNKEIEIED